MRFLYDKINIKKYVDDFFIRDFEREIEEDNKAFWEAKEAEKIAEEEEIAGLKAENVRKIGIDAVVEHEIFGRGIIKDFSDDNDKITIEFDDAGTKKFKVENIFERIKIL